MVSDHCGQLLDKGLQYNVFYGDRLSNHLPMTLIALDRIGASQAQLDQFYQAYVGRLEPLDDKAPQPRSPSGDNPPDFAGGVDTATLLGYRDDYLKQMDSIGLDATLQQSLPVLIPGMGSAGFHCLIRLSYAIQAQHLQEIAYALAYWRASYFPLGELRPRVDAKPMAVIRAMSNVVRRHRFGAGNIVDRMSEVVQLLALSDKDDQPKHLTMAMIADCALRVYQMTRDFTMLHGVTGSHALMVILPWCDDQELALRYFWQALLVAYLSTGASPMHPVNPTPVSVTWPQLLERCCHSHNDHQIKLCYSCWQLSQAFDNPRYLQVAAAIAADS